MKMLSAVMVAALTVATLPSLPAAAAAAPIAAPVMLRGAVAPTHETVRYRGGGWRGGGAGVAIGAGIAGALIGGAIIGATRPQGYGYQGYYGDQPGYYRPGYVAAPYGGDAVAYCRQRYRSYDPYSGSYLGFDGYRHPCP